MLTTQQTARVIDGAETAEEQGWRPLTLFRRTKISFDLCQGRRKKEWGSVQ